MRDDALFKTLVLAFVDRPAGWDLLAVADSRHGADQLAAARSRRALSAICL